MYMTIFVLCAVFFLLILPFDLRTRLIAPAIGKYAWIMCQRLS